MDICKGVINYLDRGVREYSQGRRHVSTVLMGDEKLDRQTRRMFRMKELQRTLENNEKFGVRGM